jgi:hypothetical protein
MNRVDEEHGEEAAAAFPWPPSPGVSPVAAVAGTWRGAALSPRSFFRGMPEHGSVSAALLYYLPLGIAIAGADLFWTTVRGTAVAEREAELGSLQLGGGIGPVVEFLLSPLALLLILFLAAGATHLMLRLVGGANRDFAFTTRIYAFAYSPQILGIIPIVGGMAGFAWMVVVAVIGVREGQRTTTGRALAAVLVPVAIGLILAAVATFVAGTGSLILH